MKTFQVIHITSQAAYYRERSKHLSILHLDRKHQEKLLKELKLKLNSVYVCVFVSNSPR